MRSLESTLVSVKIKALEERLDDIDNRLDILFPTLVNLSLRRRRLKS
jgi:hypothetical protein